VLSDGSGDDDDVAGGDAVGAEVDAVGQQADTGGVDVEPVAVAAVDHLGVAGDHGDPGRPGGCAERGGDAAELVDRQALLEHHPDRQVERHGPRHGQVVDGAVHGQVADAPAGEEPRPHDVGVGGEGQPRAAGHDHGRVAEPAELAVAPAEGRQVDVLVEVAGEPPAAAVAHDDGRVVAQRQRARPGLEVDGLGHVRGGPSGRGGGVTGEGEHT
jgi:hypothetical protein